MATDYLPQPFVQRLLACQGRLEAYIRTLIPDADTARDLLQQANLVICQKAVESEGVQNFAAWTCRVAFYQVLAHRRDCGRDRLLFDDELLGDLAQVAEERVDLWEDRVVALRSCIDKLPAEARALLHDRHGLGRSVKDIADSAAKVPNAVSKMLH
ncbi:MAG: RNA polymerase subunit sigma-70, partial [Pirellulales bacterium]